MTESRLTWVLSGLVVATAVSALLTRPPSGLPGVLEFAVLEGAGEARTERALAPLREYLAQSARRAVEISVVTAEELGGNRGDFDLALVPTTFLESWGDRADVLARGRTHSMMGLPSRPYWLQRRGSPWSSLQSPRVIFGDRHTWSGGEGANEYLQRFDFDDRSRFALAGHGTNPFDHQDAIAALVHGAYDLAIVREADVRRAVDRAFVDLDVFEAGPAGSSTGDFLLLADTSLSDKARDRLRAAALNLDLYRFDRPNYRVLAIMEAMQVLGLEGFAPYTVLPSLRP